MKVSPDEVAIPGRKAWKNRYLAVEIVTRLLPALSNFLKPVSLTARDTGALGRHFLTAEARGWGKSNFQRADRECAAVCVVVI
jgi:hypothetical protein